MHWGNVQVSVEMEQEKFASGDYFKLGHMRTWTRRMWPQVRLRPLGDQRRVWRVEQLLLRRLWPLRGRFLRTETGKRKTRMLWGLECALSLVQCEQTTVLSHRQERNRETDRRILLTRVFYANAYRDWHVIDTWFIVMNTVHIRLQVINRSAKLSGNGNSLTFNMKLSKLRL